MWEKSVGKFWWLVVMFVYGSYVCLWWEWNCGVNRSFGSVVFCDFCY